AEKQDATDPGGRAGLLSSRQWRDAAALRARRGLDQTGRSVAIRRDHHHCGAGRDDAGRPDRDPRRREARLLALVADGVHRPADPRRDRRLCHQSLGRVSRSDPGRRRRRASERGCSGAGGAYSPWQRADQCRAGRGDDGPGCRCVAQPAGRRLDRAGNRLWGDLHDSRQFCVGLDRVVARLCLDPEACLRAAGGFDEPSVGNDAGSRGVISTADAATWGIAALAIFGVIARPWNLPEFIWAVAGAALLVVLNLLPWQDALAAAGKGTDVYFFLAGMMLLAEVARKEALFDWLAAQAVRSSRGSAKRLFLIVYVVGTVVTVPLSNDATAVVLTPAVYAATRAAKVEPLPYLFVCAFIANAASFVLPISNPANLVVFGKAMPPLADWLRAFALPSLAAIVATYLALRLTQRRALDGSVAAIGKIAPLTRGGKLTAIGILMTAVVLLTAS